MEGSAEDHRAPESWEAADLDASMSQLMLSSNKDSKAQELAEASASSASTSTSSSAGIWRMLLIRLISIFAKLFRTQGNGYQFYGWSKMLRNLFVILLNSN